MVLPPTRAQWRFHFTDVRLSEEASPNISKGSHLQNITASKPKHFCFFRILLFWMMWLVSDYPTNGLTGSHLDIKLKPFYKSIYNYISNYRNSKYSTTFQCIAIDQQVSDRRSQIWLQHKKFPNSLLGCNCPAGKEELLKGTQPIYKEKTSPSQFLILLYGLLHLAQLYIGKKNESQKVRSQNCRLDVEKNLAENIVCGEKWQIWGMIF